MHALYLPNLYIHLCPEAWIEKLQQILLRAIGILKQEVQPDDISRT